MLTAHKLKLIHDLVKSSTKEELTWLNGYLSGIIRERDQPAEEGPAAAVAGKVTIAYGTETGNSKKLASDFAVRAKQNGIHVKVVSLDQYRLNDLSKEDYFFTVISTQGEGEPPAAARKFYDHIHQQGDRLDKLKFGVLALGDTSYPLFCKAGEDIDIQLHQLGGERIVSLLRCDVDYEDEAGHWFTDVLDKLSHSKKTTPVPAIAKRSKGKKILSGTVITNINLNDTGSAKQTHHLEIDSVDAEYQPGDSLGIIPESPMSIVEGILAITGLDRNRSFVHQGNETTAFHLLKKRLNTLYLPERVVKKYAAVVQQEIPETKIGLMDLLKIYPVKDTAQFEEVLQILEPTAPRLYSISSSPEAHAGEIHLTVAKDIFEINDEVKYGLCSDLLSQLPVGEKLEFYIHKNNQFKLPAPEKDIILIGPGTGIAPFRSFLAEREAAGANGRNWLFFGDQHFTTDFLYQTELQNWLQTGLLTKLSVAFSRDQSQKIYVQHKMHNEGAELFNWLQSGAYVFVCGAKDPMSNDVEHALLEIIKQYGNHNQSAAEAYLDMLREAGRYVKDVY